MSFISKPNLITTCILLNATLTYPISAYAQYDATVDVGQIISGQKVDGLNTTHAGGEQNVYGTANNAVIENNGKQFIYDEGQSNEATIKSGGQITVTDNGKVNVILVENGGKLTVTGEGAKNSSEAHDIDLYGTMEVHKGKLVDNVNIYNDGVMTIRDQLNSAQITNTVIKSGGKQIIQKSSNVIGTKIEGGTQEIHGGSIVTQTTIYSGLQIVGGQAINTDIFSGGKQKVETGGSITNTTVYDGGILELVGNATTLNGTVTLNDTGQFIANSEDYRIINNGDLIFNQTIDTIIKSVVDGTGSITKNGNSTLILNAKNTYTGITEVNSGQLIVGNIQSMSNANQAAIAGKVNIANNGHVAGVGSIGDDVKNLGTISVGDISSSQSLYSVATFTLMGQLDNSGTINIGRSDVTNTSGVGNVLHVNGDYIGNNGSQLNFNTVLGNDNSTTDKFIIDGQASGTTLVTVNNVGGFGAQTQDGIKLIETQGTTADAFKKNGRIVAGSYDYDLVNKGNNWYLTSEFVNLRPETGSYLANLSAANNLFNIRLHDRLGETQYTDAITGEQKVTSLWLRQVGGHNRFNDGSGQLRTQSNRYVIQLGGDIAQWSANGLDRWHLGLMTGYANSRNSTHSNLTGYSSRGHITGYSVGIYGTWYANEQDKNGTYIDSWLQYNWFDNKVSGDNLATEKYDSDGLTASIEAGYTFRISEFDNNKNSYWLQPKAQITWMNVQADNHIEKEGTRVIDNTNGNLQTRFGIKAYVKNDKHIDENQSHTFQPFVEANWIHNTRNYSIKMNETSSQINGSHNIGELKIGGEGSINQHLQLWGNVAQQFGENNYRDTQATIGIKYSF